jgi:hypothetical protein
MNIQKLFDRYNAQYFGGRLSGYTVIVSDRFGGQGLCRRKQGEIHIRPDLVGLTRRRILIHEMAHASAKDRNHGPIWIKEMKRLHKLGAPTARDIKEYSDPNGTESTADLINTAEDHGMEIGDPSFWRNYKLSECYSYGLCDTHGRAESARAAKLIRKIREAFLRGVKQRQKFDSPHRQADDLEKTRVALRANGGAA